MVAKNAECSDNNNMRRQATLTMLAVFIGCSLGISGCASRSITVKEASYPVGQVDAQGLFHENCIVCHGENGRAHTFHGWLVGAQNLTDPKWQSETSDAQIVNAIKTGPSVMPAFEKKLSPTEINALAVYVRTFKQNQ
jgi:cbb3-type cytochrome c oxidase subunit III